MKLEYVESLILAHPFVKGFDQVSYCITEEEVLAVAQGDISDVISNRKKEDMEGKEGVSPVYSTTFYIGLQIEDKPGRIFFLQHDCIDPFLRFFKLVLLVHGGLTYRILQRNSPSLLKCGRSLMTLPWELSCDISKGLTFLNIYREPKNEVIFRSALPDNVFDPGERPAKLVQKRVKVGFFWKMKLTI
jgi:poly(A) polymerase